MAQSTITDKFQTAIPVEVRLSLNMKPRQPVSHEVKPDGSSILRAEPGLEALFGSLKIKKSAASIRTEKQSARHAIACEAAKEGLS